MKGERPRTFPLGARNHIEQHSWKCFLLIFHSLQGGETRNVGSLGSSDCVGSTCKHC